MPSSPQGLMCGFGDDATVLSSGSYVTSASSIQRLGPGGCHSILYDDMPIVMFLEPRRDSYGNQERGCGTLYHFYCLSWTSSAAITIWVGVDEWILASTVVVVVKCHRMSQSVAGGMPRHVKASPHKATNSGGGHILICCQSPSNDLMFPTYNHETRGNL